MDKLIIVDDYGTEYEHGTIDLISRCDGESNVEVNITLTTTEDIEDFKAELEELIAKYAI